VTANRSNIKHQISNISLVVDVLCLACVWISGQRTDRVDPARDYCSDEILSTRRATHGAVQIYARPFAYACDRRAVGRSGADSNSRTILRRGDRSSRNRPLVHDDGGPRCEFIRGVSLVTAVLFRNGLYQLFSVVDQAAVVDEKIMARPRQDRQLPYHWRCDHFHHFHFDQNQIAALHPAGLSPARASASAQVGPRK